MATIQQTQNFPPNYDGTMVATGPIVPPSPVAPPGRNPYARRSAGIPIPPMPVMPPEGIAPVTDPASTGTAPDASPTTMVLQYLKARGYTPSSENVRRALEANARDPGVIPGLRSDRPATDAEDQAAMRAAGAGGGRGGGGGGGLVREEGSWDNPSGVGDGSAGRTSAAPSSWRGPFSGPPDPTNTLTTDVDQAARLALRNPPGPEYGLTSDYTRPPLPGSQGGGGGGGGGPPPTEPPPSGPVGDSVTKALGGPPEQLRLPAPPDVPRLPPPSVLPNPGVPVPEVAPAPVAAPMPEVPSVVGQAARPPIRTSTTLRGPGSSAAPPGPAIAPGNRIQGAPIQPGPYAGPLGRAVVGGIAGATRGVPGAIAGAAPGVVDLARQILGR